MEEKLAEQRKRLKTICDYEEDVRAYDLSHLYNNKQYQSNTAYPRVANNQD